MQRGKVIVLTFMLDGTGKMEINYGYEDISELSPVEKQEKWEAENLVSHF